MLERWCWVLMVWLVKRWANRYMDQWDKVKFDSEWGTVYLTISRADPYPDSFHRID